MKFLKLIIALLLSINFSCDNKDLDDELGGQFNTEILEKIAQDEELFTILQQIATDDETPQLNITCINFRYPMTVFTLDENNEFLSLDSVLDDEELSVLLANINSDHSISVSFPIEATLETGEEFIITTKEELRASIDQCLELERIVDSRGFLENCLFKVGYSFNYENSFLGAIIQEADGFANFSYKDHEIIGSWTPLFIEDELHININFVEADEEVSDFFNYNWVVDDIDATSLTLRKDEREIVFKQRCDEDFDLCFNFLFEVCENEVESEISNFILNDYTFCILDTLRLEEEALVSYHLTKEDAENNENPIDSEAIFNNTENNQSIYVKITDMEEESEYIVEIILVSTSC